MGRRAEREAVEHLLAQAQAGRSGVLVVRGEAGIGKSALLGHTRDTAHLAGFRVESMTGVQAESQFAFAGLHQLCALLLERRGELPEPQQAALGVAFGLQAGAAPDRFLVGLAVLNLLAEVAEEEPLLCLVDDAQWLDRASAEVLAFVARRVGAERLALVFAVRDSVEAEALPFSGMAEVRLGPLGETDARALLAGAVRAPLDEVVRARIVAESRGNPLALLELPHVAQPAHLTGGFEVLEGPDVPRRVEDSFRQRSGSLPAQTQLLLLVAAAEPTGDQGLLWRAAERLGLGRDTADPAEAAGLLAIDTRVRFRHPLVRSAVYQAASGPDRRRAHSALAEATDPDVDPDRRAWHRGQAVLGVDEEAAAGLERSAERARARGGLAAAGAFLKRATELTPEPATRAGRALAAAHDKHEAGVSEVALELLTVAETGPLDALQRARIELLRAQIAFHLTRDSSAPGMLLDAATTLAPLDAALSRETYLQALGAATVIGSPGPGRGVREVAQAARDAPPAPGAPRPADLLLEGLVTAVVDGYEAGVPGLRRALEAFRAPQPAAQSERDDSRWLWLASRIALALFDDDLLHELASQNVQHARAVGSLATLPAALLVQSFEMVLSGKLARAAELAAEEGALAQATGALPWHVARLVLAAWRGQQEDTADLHTATVDIATGRSGVSLAHYALAVLHNGLGSFPTARDAAAEACRSDELAHASFALPEFVEAASRAGDREQAVAALERLSSRAHASGTPWALGLAARSRALTTDGTGAEQHFREAIEHLGACRMTIYLARTHLVYGEWLRREGRRRDARDQLRTAHELLSDMGAEAFADRAARELRATGEHPRKRTAQPTDALTSHELHIARLVATGATSREVGAQLFLSPRTIEAHLRNIFRKLGITSRRQLKDLRLP